MHSSSTEQFHQAGICVLDGAFLFYTDAITFAAGRRQSARKARQLPMTENVYRPGLCTTIRADVNACLMAISLKNTISISYYFIAFGLSPQARWSPVDILFRGLPHFESLGADIDCRWRQRRFRISPLLLRRHFSTFR